MKAFLKICVATLALALSFVSTARAENHLEVSAALSPLTIGDDSYEAFNDSNVTMPRVGLDVRYELANLKGFKFAPFVGYRFGSDGGQPFYFLDTNLKTHDLLAGVRIRKGLTNFMGLYLDAMVGASYADINGEIIRQNDIDYDSGFEGASTYQDGQWTWTAGGLVGAEFYFSRSWMRTRGLNRVNFGAELGLGYLARGTLDLEPQLQSEGDNALPISDAGDWGSLNQSGFLFQFALTASFY